MPWGFNMEECAMDTYAREYIIQGFYPNGDEFRAEVVANSWTDAAAMAQGLIKVTTLRETFLIDARKGWLEAKFTSR